MNAAGATAERVYDVLKRLVLTGAWRPGARLDPAVLAERVDSSVTPVRAALNMLVGEGLVETGTGEGFRLPLIDEPALCDRYSWNAELLALALRRAGAPNAFDLPAARPDELARAAAQLFLAIVRGSPNLEHVRAMHVLNDRLHAVRLAEAVVLEGVEPELMSLARAASQADRARLRALLAGYHRRRLRAASAILRQLYRQDASALL